MIAAGRPLPYIIDAIPNRNYANGAEHREITIRLAVQNNRRDSYVAALPNIITGTNLADVLPPDPTGHTFAESELQGLELSNISDAKDGYHTVLTITYSSSQIPAGTLAWWTSESAGMVYHERTTIPNTTEATEQYSQYALTPKFGLTPNGANLTPTPNAGTIPVEASWGPATLDSINEDSSDADPGGKIDMVTTSTSSTSIPVPDEALALSMGLMVKDESSHGLTDIMATIAMIESGQITHITDKFNDLDGWYYNSPDPVNKVPYDQLPNSYSPEEIIAFAKALNSKPTISLPTMQINIRRTVKRMTMLDVNAALSKVGTRSPSITISGANYPAPQMPIPEKFDGYPRRTVFEYRGRSIDQQKAKRRFQGTGSAAIAFYDLSYTDSYTLITELKDDIRSSETVGGAPDGWHIHNPSDSSGSSGTDENATT